jgi:hypothetical protein
MLKLKISGSITTFSMCLYVIEVHQTQGLLYFVHFLLLYSFLFKNVQSPFAKRICILFKGLCFP